MEATLFLLVTSLAGCRIAYLLPGTWRLEDRLFIGVPVGLATGTLLVFAASLLLGFSPATIASVTATLGMLTVGSLWPASGRRQVQSDIRELPQRARTSTFWLGVAVYLGLASLLSFIFAHALFVQNGVLYAGFSNVWGDWNQHLSQTTSFAYGQNFPPELTVKSGQKLGYPFLTNLLSATLIKGGYGLVTAMVTPAVVLTLAGLGLVMTFARTLAGRTAAILAPLLVYFSGGLGFVNFFGDLWNTSQSLGNFFANLPHQYTLTWGQVALPNISWINMIYAYLVPQRAFLFGLPLVLIVLTLLYRGLRERQRFLMLAAGLVASLLPLIHTHGLVFLGILTPFLIWLTRQHVLGRRKLSIKNLRLWWYFLVPISLIGLPQFLWLTTGVNGAKFFQPQFGWVKHEDEFFWFWLKNAWLFIPLLLASLVWLRRRNPLLRSFTVAVATVFVAANVFVFQPWDWDNTKLLVYWYIASVPTVVTLLLWLAQRSRAWRIGVVAIVISMTLSGLFDVSRTLQPSSYKVELFDARGQEMATYIREHSDPQSVWLTAQNANNVVAALAGRRIVLGYTGWLWSYGIEYTQREQDVRTMFEHGPDADKLLATYDVDYVVIGPVEHDDKGYAVNEEYYASHYQRWAAFGPVNVYNLHQPLR